MTPLDENRSINTDRSKSYNHSDYISSPRSVMFSREFLDSSSYQKSRSVELFIATMCNDVHRIENYLKIYNDGINDLDRQKRNAMQLALYSNNLTVETCNALIRFGINLNQTDCDGNNALGRLVYFYNAMPFLSKGKLPLFRCIVEGGADINVKFNFYFKKTNIRERIKSNPELEAIVQDINAKRANHVYAAIGADFCVTKLVCEILDLSPASNWRPVIN